MSITNAPRPTYNANKELIKQHVLSEMYKALIEMANFDESEQLLSDLKDILRYEDDSLDIAMRLKSNGYWFENSQAIEAIDYGLYTGSEKLRELIKKWVIDNSIFNKYIIEERVSYIDHKKEIVNCTIVGVNFKEAYYILHEDRSEKPIKYGCGVCINFEKVTKINN